MYGVIGLCLTQQHQLLSWSLVVVVVVLLQQMDLTVTAHSQPVSSPVMLSLSQGWTLEGIKLNYW